MLDERQIAELRVDDVGPNCLEFQWQLNIDGNDRGACAQL